MFNWKVLMWIIFSSLVMKKARFKTKNRKRDYDQIADDTKPEKAEKLLNQEPDIELPGEAQFYCVPCARHFIDDKSLSCHQKSKNHKKQIAKILDNNAFDHKESLAAAGKKLFIYHIFLFFRYFQLTYWTKVPSSPNPFRGENINLVLSSNFRPIKFKLN